MFRPRLLEQEIKDEALRLLHQAKLLCAKELERNRLTEQEVQLHTLLLKSPSASVRVSLCCHKGIKCEDCETVKSPVDYRFFFTFITMLIFIQNVAATFVLP